MALHIYDCRKDGKITKMVIILNLAKYNCSILRTFLYFYLPLDAISLVNKFCTFPYFYLPLDTISFVIFFALLYLYLPLDTISFVNKFCSFVFVFAPCFLIGNNFCTPDALFPHSLSTFFQRNHLLCNCRSFIQHTHMYFLGLQN